MKVHAPTETLRTALAAACKIVPRNHHKEILTQVKMVAGDDGVTLQATNLEMAVTLDVPGCQVEQPGTILLPAHRIVSVLGVAGNEYTELTEEGNALVVLNGVDGWEIGTMPPDEYPSVNRMETDDYIDIDAEVFRRAVGITAPMTETDSARFALGAVLLTAESDSSLTFVGTDGRRLSTTTCPAEVCVTGEDPWQDTMVPGKCLEIMAASVRGTVRIRRTVNAVEIETDGAVLMSRQLDGRYPNWRQVLPDTGSYETLTLPAAKLASTIRKAAVMNDRESRGVDFNIEDGEMTVSAKVEDSQAKAMMIVAYHDDPIYFTADNKYILQWLLMQDQDGSVDLMVKDFRSPMLFVAGDEKYVVMPMANDAHQARYEGENAEQDEPGQDEAEPAEA